MAHFGWHSEAINHPNLEQLWRTSRVFMEKPCEHEFPPPKKTTWMIEPCWAMLSLSSATHWIQGFPTEAGGFNKFCWIHRRKALAGLAGRATLRNFNMALEEIHFWMERYFREVSGNLNDGFSISNCQEVKVGPQDPPWKRMRLDSDGRFDQQWDFDQNGYKWDIQQTEQGYFSDGSGIYTTLTDLYLHNPKCQ